MGLEINLIAEIAFIIVSLFLSAYFSAMETVLLIVGDNKIKEMLSNISQGAVDKWKNNRSRYFNTLYFGNTIFNTLVIIFTLDVFYKLFPKDDGFGIRLGVSIIAIIVILVLAIFTEIFPKILARSGIFKLGSTTLFFLNVFYYLFLPITALFDVFRKPFIKIVKRNNEQDLDVPQSQLEEIINSAEIEGNASEDTSLISKNILEIGEIDVKEVMVPRMDLTAVSIDISDEEFKHLVQTSHYSRIPVYRNSLDNIVGILYIKDVIRINLENYNMAEFEQYLRKPLFVPETKKLDVMLKDFQNNRLHLAVVVDEYGGTAGIVTMEDILEEIVGDIFDEYDILNEQFKKIADNKYIVRSRMDMQDFCTEFNIENFDDDTEDYETIGGLIFDLAGEMPKIGDSFEWNNLVLSVRTMKKRSIDLIEVVVKNVESDADLDNKENNKE